MLFLSYLGTFWKNELTRGFLIQFRTLWHIMDLKRIFISKVMTISSLKNVLYKKTFRPYEWRNTSRDPCLANSTSEFPTTRHMSNSSTWLAKCLQRVTPSEFFFLKQTPFKNKFLKGIRFGQFATQLARLNYFIKLSF